MAEVFLFLLVLFVVGSLSVGVAGFTQKGLPLYGSRRVTGIAAKVLGVSAITLALLAMVPMVAVAHVVCRSLVK